MRVLIVEHNADLAELWAAFLRRGGITVDTATCQAEAINRLRFSDYDALVLQVVLPDGGAIAISDYATYRNPEVPIITVTSNSFFSDGSIFDLIPNARSMLSVPLRPSDLVALVEHVGSRSEPDAAPARDARADPAASGSGDGVPGAARLDARGRLTA